MRCNRAAIESCWLLIAVCGAAAGISGGRHARCASRCRRKQADEAGDGRRRRCAADEPAKTRRTTKRRSAAAQSQARRQSRGQAEAAADAGSAPDDPAVLAVLESHPETPAELLRAIDILVDLEQARLAKPFVDELAKRKLDLAAKAALAHQFNSAMLLKLAHDAELGPVLGAVCRRSVQSGRGLSPRSEAAGRLGQTA